MSFSARVWNTLTCFTRRQRRIVRVLLALATIALLLDGFLIERSILHLLLLHPLLLMALICGLLLTETADSPASSHER